MIFKTHIRGNQRRNQEASHLIYEWFADFFTPIQFPQMPTGTWRITVIWHLPTTNTVAAKYRLTALISEDENESRWSERGLLDQRSQNTEARSVQSHQPLFCWQSKWNDYLIWKPSERKFSLLITLNPLVSVTWCTQKENTRFESQRKVKVLLHLDRSSLRWRQCAEISFHFDVGFVIFFLWKHCLTKVDFTTSTSLWTPLEKQDNVKRNGFTLKSSSIQHHL